MKTDTKPNYSKKRVNKAGENVRENITSDEDILVIENWRAAHNHILNAWQATLRKRCKDKNVVFAQRLKRKNTIFDKLQREPKMHLSRMHDIAGCRLIFKNIESLQKYRKLLHKAKMNHVIKSVSDNAERYDYIISPTSYGYRGIHDVYEWIARPKRPEDWDGLLVEIQYRTVYQHAWATAVEVAGSVTGNHAKFKRGSEDNKEFFRLASEIIARVYEERKSCKADLTDAELVDAFKKIENDINLLRNLKGIKAFKKHLPNMNNKNVVLIFSKKEGKTTLRANPFQSRTEATKRYFELEKEYADDETDVVLVKADSKNAIKNAFRNYFDDTKDFVFYVEEGVKILKKQIDFPPSTI